MFTKIFSYENVLGMSHQWSDSKDTDTVAGCANGLDNVYRDRSQKKTSSFVFSPCWTYQIKHSIWVENPANAWEAARLVSIKIYIDSLNKVSLD